MENSKIFYLKFGNKRDSEFRSCNQSLNKFYNFPKEVHGHGCGHNVCKNNKITTLVEDGDRRRRSKKNYSIDGMKRIAETHITEKRNARERCRVRAVNEAFCRLRRIIPTIATRRKRVSKVKTLQKALQYIIELQRILKSFD